MNFFNFFAAAGALTLSISANAAISFTEDFSSNTAGGNLVVTGGSAADIDFSAGTARFTGTNGTGSGRAYLGTNTAFDLGVDFVVEVGVIIPNTSGGNGVAFFGFGAGQRGDSTGGGGAPSYYEPSDGPATYIALIPDDFGGANAGKIAYADYDTTVTGGTAGAFYQSGGLDVLLGSGSHRLQMSYSASTNLLQFSYKENGIGSFVALGPALLISDNGFSSSTGQLFFGGSGNVTFDNVSLVVPPPLNAELERVTAQHLTISPRKDALSLDEVSHAKSPC